MSDAPSTPPVPAQPAAQAPGTITDPYRAYNFKLEIQGVTEAHFTSCNGLGISVEVIRYREAGLRQGVRMIPGPVTYEPVTLNYGLTTSRDLFDWLMKAVNGTVERKNVSIIIVDPSGTDEIMRWNLSNAWASSWRGAFLDAMSQEIAIESVTLVYESMERA